MSGVLSLLVGLTILGAGAAFVWRSRWMQRLPASSADSARRAKQYRDSGVVMAVAGLIIVAGSLVVISQRGL